MTSVGALSTTELQNISFFNPPGTRGTWTYNPGDDLPGGDFIEAGQGLVVSVADSPCDFTDPTNPVCPTAKAVCGRITRPRMCPFIDSAYCPLAVDCGGVTAKYVRVSLPGQDRLLNMDIRVHRHRPRMDTEERSRMVCYGVGKPNEIFKALQYKDMDDPAFYSTCYVKFRGGWLKFPRFSHLVSGILASSVCFTSYDQGTDNLNAETRKGEGHPLAPPRVRMRSCMVRLASRAPALPIYDGPAANFGGGSGHGTGAAGARLGVRNRTVARHCRVHNDGPEDARRD